MIVALRDGGQTSRAGEQETEARRNAEDYVSDAPVFL